MRLRPYRPYGLLPAVTAQQSPKETFEPCSNATAEDNREANVQTKACKAYAKLRKGTKHLKPKFKHESKITSSNECETTQNKCTATDGSQTVLRKNWWNLECHGCWALILIQIICFPLMFHSSDSSANFSPNKQGACRQREPHTLQFTLRCRPRDENQDADGFTNGGQCATFLCQ